MFHRLLSPPFRLPLLLLGLLPLLPTATLGIEETLAPLAINSEPYIGDAMNLGFRLSNDAAELLKKDPEACARFEDSLASINEGNLVLAFAQSQRFLDAAQSPLEKARGQLRQGLIYILAGSLHLGASLTNETLDFPELHGELHLARAHANWQMGRFKAANTEIALAAAAKPAAPQWALDRWKAERDPKQALAATFETTEMPPTEGSPEQLHYLEQALQLGAYGVVDAQLGIALTHLLQDKMAQVEGAEAKLLLCHRLQRNRLTKLLRPLLYPGARETWTYFCYIANGCCSNGGDKSDWDLYLGALLEGMKRIPDFDLTIHNLVHDVTEAEKAGASKALLDAFRPLAAQPRLRYASQLLEVVRRYEDMPQSQTVLITDSLEFTADELADFQKVLAYLNEADATTQTLRAKLPVGSAPVGPEHYYQETIARARLLDALLRKDLPEARKQLALYEGQGRTEENAELLNYRKAVATLAEKDFPAEILALATLSTEQLATEKLSDLALRALSLEARLQKAHGKDALDLTNLNGEELELQRSIVLLRLLNACASGSVSSAEALLMRLEALCDPKHLPGFTPLESSIQRVAALPFVLTNLKDEGVVQVMKDLEAPNPSDDDLEELDEAVDSLAEDLFVDSLREGILRTILHFRQGDEAAARQQLAELRAATPRNRAARAEFDRVEREYTPALRLASAIRDFQSANPATCELERARMTRLANRHLRVLRKLFGPETLNNPAKLPPGERATLLQSALALSLEASARQRLLPALQWALVLSADEKLQQPALLALSKLPLRFDLPDDAAAQLWKDVPVLNKLPKERLKEHLDTLNRHRGTSVYVRLTEFLWVYKQARWDQAEAKLRELTPLLSLHPRTLEVVQLIERTLRSTNEQRRLLRTRMEYADKERTKYFNDYNSTVSRLNGESEDAIARDQETRRRALAIQEARDGGYLSAQEALSQIERLQATSEASDGNEYTRRNRQRSLDFLPVAKQKISQYDQELKDLAEAYNSLLRYSLSTLQDELEKLAEQEAKLP